MQTESQHMILAVKGREYRFLDRTHVLGILNVTPDSFSDGGRFSSIENAVERAVAMVNEGADFIDVGGESSRPGSDPLPVDEELSRVIPVVERLAKEVDVPISIDTTKARVAVEALAAGASFINDISAMTADPAMIDVVRTHQTPIILMHMRGKPKTMQADPYYEDVVKEVSQYLTERVQAAKGAGSPCVIVDPGIGFGKTVQHNLLLLRRMHEIAALGWPVLSGPSRKSFLGTILGTPVGERLEGTAAAVAASILHGAHIIRVHDVLQMKRVAQVIDAVARS